jgi:hypothetical protein
MALLRGDLNGNINGVNHTPYTGPLVGAIATASISTLKVSYLRSSVGGGRLEFVSINQTSEPTDQGFETTTDASLLTGWLPAKAAVTTGDPLSVTVTSSAGSFASGGGGGGGGASSGSVSKSIRGVRYSWSVVQAGQFLYDTATGTNFSTKALPAGPFLARCTADACTLVEPGQVPGPPTPTPPPTLTPPPTPTPPPPSSQCTVLNNTKPRSNAYYVRDLTPLGNVSAPVCDVAECCGICRGDAKCAGAYVKHGPKLVSTECYCELYSAAEVAKGTVLSVSKYPEQNIWVTPEATEAGMGYVDADYDYEYTEF